MTTTANPFLAPQADDVADSQPRDFADLDFKQLKALRNHSSTIQVLGVLWVIGAAANIIVGLLSLTDHAATTSMPVINLGIGLLAGCAAYGALKRPHWGRGVGMLLCAVALIGFPLGTAIGLIGLIALGKGGCLFGDDKIEHKALNAEYKYRKKNKIR